MTKKLHTFESINSQSIANKNYDCEPSYAPEFGVMDVKYCVI
jgi:hypothetical protein